jgi:hypothetical protein
MGRAKWWGLAGEQVITLTSVLHVRVQWKNQSTYQYQLGDLQHEELLHLCKCVQVLEPNFQRAAGGQYSLKHGGGAHYPWLEVAS